MCDYGVTSGTNGCICDISVLCNGLVPCVSMSTHGKELLFSPQSIIRSGVAWMFLETGATRPLTTGPEPIQRENHFGPTV